MVLPVTVAVNCWLCEAIRVTEVGLMETDTGGLRVSEEVREAALNVAVMAARTPAVTDAPVAVKVAEVAPAGTRTEAGTVRLALLLLNVTVAPPLGAALFSVTVQLAVPGVVMVEGLQDTDVSRRVPAVPEAGLKATVIAA